MLFRSTYVKLNVVRRIISLLLFAVAVCASAQFKVDPQKIPIVQSKRRALVIGASNFQHLGKLNYASSDAERFRDALISGFKFTPDSIRFISDSPDSVEKPDSRTIIKALHSLLADPTLDKGDLFILFFSGHGMGKDESDYFCATDSTVSDVEKTGLPVKTIVTELKNSGLRNILIIADACRAGNESRFGVELNDLSRKTNIAVLLGCEPGKKSYEAPALRSGVFTHFLLRALANPKNRTESGGLWASRIAQSVESLVLEYTKHDYGDNAQKPVAFADPTSDVLLAKFVDANKTRSLIDSNVVVSPQKVADELTLQVPDLLNRGDYNGALEASKQALSLDSTNYYDAYYASIATIFLGRTGEHEKYCDLLKACDNPYFRNLGHVQSESRQTPLADRLKQLELYWDGSPKDEVHATLVWGKARIFAPMFAVKALLERMLPSLPVGRLRSFFEGEIAIGNNQIEIALAKYRMALGQPIGNSLIGDDVLIVMQFPLLRQLQRSAELKALLEEQLKRPDISPLVWVSIAVNLRAIGERQQAIDLVKKRIGAQALTEEQVVMCALTAGSSIVDIVDELEAQVKFKPYSWKVRAAAIVAKGIKTKDAAATSLAFESARKYCDDDLEIISLTYSIENAIIEDAESFLNISPEKFATSNEMFRMMFLDQIQKMGDDSEKWYQLGELGLSTMEGPQTMRLFKKYLKDFNARSSLGSEFYTMLFRLATSTEEDDIAKFAAQHPSLNDPDRSDIRLLYVAYLISKGNYADARKEFKSVAEVSPVFSTVKQSVVLVLKARSGEIVPLKRFIALKTGDTEADLVAEGIAALTLADLGQTDEALPHLARLSKFNLTMVSSVTLRCVERYLKLLKAAGKTTEADDLLFFTLQSNQISPGVKASYFGTKPDRKNYVGTMRADTFWFSDELYDEKNPTHKDQIDLAAVGKGSISLTVALDGTVTGSVSIEGGLTYSIKANFDALGNLQGEATSGKVAMMIESKLLPNEFKQTESFKKSSSGQIIAFTSESGHVYRWLLTQTKLHP